MDHVSRHVAAFSLAGGNRFFSSSCVLARDNDQWSLYEQRQRALLARACDRSAPRSTSDSRSVRELPDRLINVRPTIRTIYRFDTTTLVAFLSNYLTYRRLPCSDVYFFASLKINRRVHRDVLYTSNTPHFPILDETNVDGTSPSRRSLITRKTRERFRVARRLEIFCSSFGHSSLLFLSGRANKKISSNRVCD